jgi:predicted ribosome quality control (RQC) complex YloA/Tae2 family protein
VAIRIPYDSLTLRAAAEELRKALAGGVAQHVAQPAPTDLILTIRSRGASRMLLLSCEANSARVHLTAAKRPNPPVPPPFCMLCRKYLEGARVTAVEQRGFDRILDLDFAAHGGESFRLAAELMGKHSNLILLTQTATILDAAKRIPRRLSRFREVLPGLPYLAPPAQEEKTDPFAVTPEELAACAAEAPADPEAFAARLMAHFAGLSPFLAMEIALRARMASLAEAWAEIFGAARAGEWLPVVVRNERGEPLGAYPFPTVQFPADAQHSRDTINTALDHYYGIALPRAARDAAARALETALSHALKTRERQRESLLRSLEEAGRAEEYKQTGELLLANLHRIPPESDSVTVTDYYAPDAPERVIPLDPALSSQENAESCFRRYRKARDGAQRQRAQLERAEEDLRALRAAQERLTVANDVEELRALHNELTGAGLLRAEQGAEVAGEVKRAPDFQGRKIRVVRAPEGWDIYVGENSEANDYLTGRVAGPNDLWLHVRANTSAHVVIRTGNNPQAVPQAVLRQAALLAARHSPARHSSLVPVDYTLRKYVRRPRGAPSGTVHYQKEKTLYVSPKTAET